MRGTPMRHISVICHEKYKATTSPPNTPQLACNPSPNLILNPSSKSMVYSANAATTSPGLLLSKNAISCAKTLLTYSFLTRFVILAAPYGMKLIPTNAKTANTTAKRSITFIAPEVASNTLPVGLDKSSISSPKMRFMAAKLTPTQHWMKMPTVMMVLSADVPWRKRAKKETGLASVYLSSSLEASLFFLTTSPPLALLAFVVEGDDEEESPAPAIACDCLGL
mmetsp:Transcript_9147/g.19311  ORF Transcript_9147/g.19311 Transcript_9147/m.19311 type:complete len:223 (+) Transcript_9147:178-846(+)